MQFLMNRQVNNQINRPINKLTNKLAKQPHINKYTEKDVSAWKSQ